MDIEQIIQKWYMLATGGNVDNNDIFFQFVAAWVAFNALYTSKHSNDVGDWEQVRSFAGEPDAIDRHRDLLRNDSEYKVSVSVLQERGVYNTHRRFHRRIRHENNLTEVVGCLYQVRCNLFHGGKMPDNPRDRRLVSASYYIVAKLVEPYIK